MHNFAPLIRCAAVAVLLLTLLCAVPPTHLSSAAPPSAPSLSRNLRAPHLQLPLHFEANRGQADERVQFLARGNGYGLYLLPDEAVLVLRRTAPPPPASLRKELPLPQVANDAASVLHIRPLHANPHPAVTAAQPLPGVSHYYRGARPQSWQRDVPSFGRVTYTGVYPGIDLVYYGHERQLEYDFVVAPGADPRAIQLEFAGSDAVRLDAQGALLVTVNGVTVRQAPPVLYQDVAGERRYVTGRYRKLGARSVGFTVGVYDSAAPLVIDPVLLYSTYLGGTGEDEGNGIAVEETRLENGQFTGGAIYVTGATNSLNFLTKETQKPCQNTGRDVFVTKLSRDGQTRLFSVYLGGDGEDVGFSLALSCRGDVYVTGYTTSAQRSTACAAAGFPATENARQGFYGGGGADAFLARLSATNLELRYATYLGGNQTDAGNGVAVDADGNAYLTGSTSSSNFPATDNGRKNLQGVRDAFLARFTRIVDPITGIENLNRMQADYVAYWGGAGNEAAYSIAVEEGADGSRSVYLGGLTTTSDSSLGFNSRAFQPKYSNGAADGGGAADAFIAKFDARTANFPLTYGSYLGGAGEDAAYGVAVAAFPNCSYRNPYIGQVYLVGYTFSDNFPAATQIDGARNVVKNAQPDAFIAKFDTTKNVAAQTLTFSTYFGGDREDVANGVAVDKFNRAYVTGRSVAPNTLGFPVPDSGLPEQARPAGGRDAFVACVDGNAGKQGLIYSTYLGGTGDDEGFAIAVSETCSAYVAGNTQSPTGSFPVRGAALQNSYGGAKDAFVARLGGTLGVNVGSGCNFDPAHEAIVAAYGCGLSTNTGLADSNGNLAGATVEVLEDRPQGRVVRSKTFAAIHRDVTNPNPDQVNFLIPMANEIAAGSAIVRITSLDGNVSTGRITIATSGVSPCIFTYGTANVPTSLIQRNTYPRFVEAAAAAVPAALPVLSYAGPLQNRVGEGTLQANQPRDGTFVVALPVEFGDRVITRMVLTRSRNNQTLDTWSTARASGAKLLGVTRKLSDSALLNPINASAPFEFNLKDADRSFFLFADETRGAPQSSFTADDNFSLRLFFADEAPITIPAINPVLTFNGKLVDRVSPAGLNADGTRDGVFTLTLPAALGDRLITRIDLNQLRPGNPNEINQTWSTTPPFNQTTPRSLGVATALRGPALLNPASGGRFKYELAAGGNLTLFAADENDTLFRPEFQYSVTVAFADEPPITAPQAAPVLTFNGKLLDRVSESGLSSDARRDGVFTLVLPTVFGDRLITQLELARTAAGGGRTEVWSTASGRLPLGVAQTVNGGLLNATPLRLPLDAGQSLVLFASDAAGGGRFMPDDSFSLKINFADDTAVTVAMATPVLTFNGKLQDRLGAQTLTADGARDGVFTVALPESFGDRVITRLVLRRTASGSATDMWSTIFSPNEPNGPKALGVARNLNSALLNPASGPFALNVAAGGSLVLFATDLNRNRFYPDNRFDLEITFADQLPVTMAAEVPVLTFNGKLFDRVSPAGYNTDGTRDAVFTAVLPVNLGDRFITRMELTRTANGSVTDTWSTAAGARPLGVARAADTTLLNPNATQPFLLEAGRSFVLFAADVDNARFQPESQFNLRIVFGDEMEITTAAASPVLTFNGKLLDRVSPNGFTPDTPVSRNDGVFTLALPGGVLARTLNRIEVERTGTGEAWSNTPQGNQRPLGVAPTLTGTLLNPGSALRVRGTNVLKLFAAENSELSFRPGSTFAVRLTFADDEPVRTAANTPVLTFNGKQPDRVGANTLVADGQPDGVFTFALPPNLGDRIITQLDLTRMPAGANSTGETWSTAPTGPARALGVALTPNDATLVNTLGTPLTLPLTAGGNLTLYAADNAANALFSSNDGFSLRATFADDMPLTGATTTPVLTYNGRLRDGVSATALANDGQNDGVLTLALPSGLLGRSLTKFDLRRTQPGAVTSEVWSTAPAPGQRPLGLATSPNGALLTPTLGAINLTGTSVLTLLAAEIANAPFRPGDQFSLTINPGEDLPITVATGTTPVLTFNGKPQDRVGTASFASDGRPDGVFTLALPSGLGLRRMTRLELTRMPASGGAGETWSTAPTGTTRALGVAAAPGDTLLNPATGQFNVLAPTGGSLTLFAADNDGNTLFRPNDRFSLKLTFADDVPLTMTTDALPQLTFNGKLVDRVSLTGYAADQMPDGVFTVAWPDAVRDRLVTRLDLARKVAGATTDLWSTATVSGARPLGVAAGGGTTLIDPNGPFAVVPDARGLTLFAADPGNRFFLTDGFELTLTFADEAPVTVTTTVPVLTFNGKLQDRVSVTAFSRDAQRDGVFTLALPASLGDRIIGLLELTRAPAGGAVTDRWRTDTSGSGVKPLGVARALTDDSLLNPTSGTFRLPFNAGGSLMLFASDVNGNRFQPTDSFALRVVFADDAPITVTDTAPVLTYNGRLTDRVATNALSTDGNRDGVFTLALPASFAARIVTRVTLARSGAVTTPVWSTTSGGGALALGLARALNGALVNGDLPNLPGGSGFTLFAPDAGNTQFQPGDQLLLTVAFTSGEPLTLSLPLTVPARGTSQAQAALTIPRFGATLLGSGYAIPTLGTSMLLATGGVPAIGTATLPPVNAVVPRLGTSNATGATVVPVFGTGQIRFEKTLPAEGPNNNMQALAYGIPRFGQTTPATTTIPEAGTMATVTKVIPLAGTTVGTRYTLPREGATLETAAIINNTLLTFSYLGTQVDRVGAGESLNPNGQADATWLAGFTNVTGDYVTLSSLLVTQGAAQVWDTPPNNGVPVLGAAQTLTGPLIIDANRATGIRDELENPVGVRFFPISLNGQHEDVLYLFGSPASAGNLFAPGVNLTLNATLVRPTQNYELIELEGRNPKPISFGAATQPSGVYDDRLFLVLYVTGLRNFKSNVTVKLGSEPLRLFGSGPQGQLMGLDQINAFLPRAMLQGRGQLELTVEVDGKTSNTVRLALGN